jgi:rhodanese-related sulfurtransferase
MRRSVRWTAACVGLLLGCDGGGWASLLDAPTFREVSAAEGHALAERAGAHLVQVGRPALAGPPIPGAALLEAGGDWPADLDDGAPVVIVASDPEAAFRLAARMARAGIQDVAVVDGGIEAWAHDPALAAADRSLVRE